MKYLSKETCLYLRSIGCTSESERAYYGNAGEWHDSIVDLTMYQDVTPEFREHKLLPAFCLEDILRQENAQKIWGNENMEVYVDDTPITGYAWRQMTLKVLATFQYHPDSWIEEVAKSIKP